MPSREDDRTKQDTDWSELTIKDFLKIPIVVYNSVTDGTSTGRLVAMRFPDQMLQSAPLREKLRGYMGIKATTVLRLAVNADKFTQGRFILTWYPDNGFNRDHNWDVYEDHQRLTQLPNVQLDVNTETEAVLCIPYRGPSSHFNLSDGIIGRFGWCMLHPLLPIQGGQVNFTIYAHLEDIELTSPTFPSGIVAQSGLDLSGKEVQKKVEKSEVKDRGLRSPVKRARSSYDLPLLASPFSFVGSDVVKPQSGLATEEHNTKLSDRARTLGNVATTLSKVPILSSVMLPLGWLSELTAGVASSLGYSKPLNTKSPESVVKRLVPRIHQYDGVDWAESLGCSSQARVALDGQLGLTAQDEMSFKFLTQIRSSIAQGTWGLDKGFGSKLATIPLSPFHMSAPSSFYAPNACAVGHPLFFLSQCFGLYRGSFELTFVFSKTAFHSGRIMIAFEPVPGASNSKIGSMDDCHYCHKDIIDVRSGHTFSITIPYTSTVPYRECYQPYGYVHVFVQNPLVLNQNNVSSSIDWMLFVNGKDDWEFAGPREPRLWPFRPSLAEPAALPRNADTVVLGDAIVPQSGLDEDHVEIISKPIGKSAYAGESHSPSALCIGEKIASVKQLCMRSKLVSVGVHKMSPDPFGVDHVYSTASAFDGGDHVGYRDWHSYFGSLYAYNRGGVVLTYHNTGLKPLNVGFAVRDKTTFSPAAGIIHKGDLFQSAYIGVGEAVRLYVPPYNRGYCRVSYDSTRVPLGDPAPNEPGTSLVRLFLQPVGSTFGEEEAPANIWRSSAEDSQFGYFIGVPLLTPCNLASEGTFPTSSLYNTDGFVS